MQGLVFDIQRFSIHDGPGIRTTVFLQGCNLKCFWCHNPESQLPGRQIQFFPEKCILCRQCGEVCPEGAQLVPDGKRVFVRDLCTTCGLCVETCFARALVIKARTMSVEQVLAEVERDHDYYKDSHGGVTFSGGEPALQKDFLIELLRASKQQGLHTTVDTAANLPWPTIEELVPYTDLFLVDIKAFDEETHRRGTGVSNERIVQNIRLLTAASAAVWVRVPVIPGYNDNAGELGRIADFLAGLKGIQRVELLPFHHLGAGKYDSLGIEYPSKGLQLPAEELLVRFTELFTSKGLDAYSVV